jgi:hypothetical protein
LSDFNAHENGNASQYDSKENGHQIFPLLFFWELLLHLEYVSDVDHEENEVNDEWQEQEQNNLWEIELP